MDTAIRRILIEMAVIGAIASGLLYALLAKPAMTATRLWPLTILVLILVIAAAIAGHAVWHHWRGRGMGMADAAASHGWPLRRYAMMAAFIAYVFLLPQAGFLPATVAFMVSAAVLLSAPTRPSSYAWAVGGAVAIHLLFVSLFEVPLPRGVLALLGN